MGFSDYLYQTVEPKDILPIARLFLRWPYQTAEHINSKLYEFRDASCSRPWLTLFELEDVHYQPEAIEPYNYKGFLLQLKGIIYPKDTQYGDMEDLFHNVFALKEDVFLSEKWNREYCALPAGHKTDLQNEICTEKNLPFLAPRIFTEIFQYHKQSGDTETATAVQISKKYLWPWLGPIIRESPEKFPSRSVGDEAEEIADFIQAARSLEQNDPHCLAKMVKYRYPRVKPSELVSLIEPENPRIPATARKTATRWLTSD